MYSKKIVFCIIIFCCCLTQFASDIYAPCLPAIATDFKVSINLVQWSMAIFLFGVAFTQLIYGPISEGIGRKKPMIFGLAVMLVGSAICVFTSNIDMLIMGRFIQGCGAGACAALWRPVFRDIYKGEELAQYGSYATIFVMFIIPAAPAVGGFLEQYINWQATFVFMLVYALLAVISMIFWFKETNPHHHLDKIKLPYIFKTYASLIKHPTFIGTAICTFLSYGAFFGWFIVGPVLLIDRIGIEPATFGLITFFGGGAAYASSGWINGKLVVKYGMYNMLRFGFYMMITAGLCMLIAYLLWGMNVYAVTIPALLFYFGSTFIWPNAFAVAFSPFGKIAGFAGALYGFMQICGGAAIGSLLSFLPDDNQLPLGLVMIGASFLALLNYEMVVRPNRFRD